jgi:hypothetical protein
LVISYELGVDPLTITPSDLAGLSQKTINADLVLVMPFALSAAASDNSINLSDMLNLDADLFKREEDGYSSDSTIYQAISSAKKVALVGTFENTSGLALEASITAYNGAFSKTLSLTEGTGTIELILTEEDIILLLESAFIPDIRLTIPEGSYELQRNAGMKLNLTAMLETDISYTVSLKSGAN